MSAPMPWFRMYTEALHDRKLKRIARETELQLTFVLGAWTQILCLASDSCIRGELLVCEGSPWTIEEMADEFDLDEKLLFRLLVAFGRHDMIEMRDGTVVVTNWEERQPKSDSSASRVRKYRARKRQPEDQKSSEGETLRNAEGVTLHETLRNGEGVTLHETLRNAEGVTDRAEQSRAEQNREEQIYSAEKTPADAGNGADAPLPPASDGISSSREDGRKRRKRRCDERYEHTGVMAVQEISSLRLPKAILDHVIEVVGEHPDVESLRHCYETWVARGYKPTNFDGWLFGWYAQHDIPAQGGNGSRGAGAKRAGRVISPPAVVDETTKLRNRANVEFSYIRGGLYDGWASQEEFDRAETLWQARDYQGVHEVFEPIWARTQVDDVEVSSAV